MWLETEKDEAEDVVKAAWAKRQAAHEEYLKSPEYCRKPIKSYFGIADDIMTEAAKQYGNMDDNITGWMNIAHLVIQNVLIRQGANGAEDYPDEFREENVAFSEMENILLHDGFIRQIEVNERKTFSYRVTLKGLAFYSCLKNILGLPDGETEAQKLMVAQVRADLCFKLLTAVNK